ncbi:MAG: tetratricopeptide repeat protein, partial [Burkholderiales bacterium]|nr:tetratricopeptide repeat protein [Anaerolineae bacterium]
QQTWNNCGPANITMALSYYGWREGQDVAASYLKPDAEDKNVNPTEIVAFVNDHTNLRAITRIGGEMELLKSFLASDFPVIVETGYMPEGEDWFGHYQTVVGYSDADQFVFIYDSYLGSGENGEGLVETYSDFDDNWQDFNRTFIVVYEQEREGEVREILGDRADLTLAAERAFDIAQTEARATPQEWAPWFNMGTSLVRLGRYEEAAVAYDQARQLDIPWRMLWYQFGPYEAYFNIGRYDDVMSLVDINLASSQGYVEETYYWQGRVLAEQGEPQQAMNAFNTALTHNPFYSAAQDALQELNV